MLSRKIHNFISIIIALPTLLLFVTGLTLAIKSKVPDIQPYNQTSERGRLTSNSKLVTLDQVLEGARSYPDSHVDSWSDVKTLDIRPHLGMARVRSQDHWEYQVDLHTGKVLSAAPRYTSLIISIHEGSFIGSFYKWGVTIPATIGLIILVITGVIIYIQSQRRKKRVSP